jgi:hypothetical protein
LGGHGIRTGNGKSFDAKFAKLATFREVEQAAAEEEADPYGMTTKGATATTKATARATTTTKATATIGVLRFAQDDGVKLGMTKFWGA